MRITPRVQRQQRPGRRGRQGFTLIEALAAIAVLMIVIPVLLQGFTIAGRIATLARQTADATALGQSKMDELIATQQWQNNLAGDSEKIGPYVYHWEPSLNSWDAGEVNVQELKMTVTWDSIASQPREVVLTTLVFQSDSTIQSSAPGTGVLP